MTRFNISTLSLLASTALCSMADPAESTAPAGSATTTVAPAAPAAKQLKPKTIADDMDSRRILTPDAVMPYITTLATYQGIDAVQWAMVGVTQDSETGAFIFDPEIYSSGVDVAVELMTEKGKAGNASVPKCIILRPNPTLESILADDKAREWLGRIATKEMNLVATRPLRKVAKVDEAVGAMPKSLGDYITGRELGGSMLESYNLHWEIIKKTLAGASKAFAIAGLSKKTLRQAMESKAFAAQNFPLLEDRGTDANGKDQSWFALACRLGSGLATKGGQSPEIFDKWLETRDSYEIESDDGAEGEFNVEAALAALSAPAVDATPTAEEKAAIEEAARAAAATLAAAA